MAALFGTDGIRAPAGSPPFTPEHAVRLGRAIALALGERGARVLLARDTRPCNAWLLPALARGLVLHGCAVLDAGVLPTPGLACLLAQPPAGSPAAAAATRAAAAAPAGGYALGIALTASHNPATDAGLKLLVPGGGKAPAALERAVEQRYAELLAAPAAAALAAVAAGAPEPVPAGPSTPLAERLDPGPYLDRLVQAAGGEAALAGVRLAIDCAHGAATAVAPAVARRLGLEVSWLAVEPDGERINAGCGALHPERLARATAEAGAALGLALDGDADRVQLADERGRVHDGDAALFALARELRARGWLRGDTVVATVASGMALEHALAAEGLRLVRTEVGDRHVAEALAAGGWTLGGESSGHLILPGLLGPTGDGLGAGLVLLRLLRERGLRASQALGALRPFPMRRADLPVAARPPLAELPGAEQALERARAALGGEGRVLVRYSGTEPLLRLLVEHRDAARAERVLGELRGALALALRRAGALASRAEQTHHGPEETS